MNQLGAAWRLLRVLAHTFRGLIVILLLFPRLSQPQKDARVQA